MRTATATRRTTTAPRGVRRTGGTVASPTRPAGHVPARSRRRPPRTGPAAVRRAMAVMVPIAWVAGAALGLPHGAHGGVPLAAGPSKARCVTTCRGHCRSARRARPLLP